MNRRDLLKLLALSPLLPSLRFSQTQDYKGSRIVLASISKKGVSNDHVEIRPDLTSQFSRKYTRASQKYNIMIRRNFNEKRFYSRTQEEMKEILENQGLELEQAKTRGLLLAKRKQLVLYLTLDTATSQKAVETEIIWHPKNWHMIYQ